MRPRSGQITRRGSVPTSMSVTSRSSSTEATYSSNVIGLDFHPTSVHIGEGGWYLLDFARAFTGPGLIDLASYHGATGAPDPVRLRVFLEQYVRAGGTVRGGLAAEAWALGRHRVWAVEWFMEQAVCWVNDPAGDSARIPAVRRRLDDAVRLLGG